MGVIGRPHGVRGLLHVHSYTAVAADLPEYGPFEDGRGRRFALRWVRDGVAEVTEIVGAKLVPVADRNAAEALVNLRLLASRATLPKPDEDEFYLADLVGLEAVGPDGAPLGTVTEIHDYGAGTSLEIGPLLVPFTRACVPEIDLAAGRLTVVVPREIVVHENAPDREGAAL